MRRRSPEETRETERECVQRFVAGHRAAAAMQRHLLAERGAQPAQAIAECLEVLTVLEESGRWPGPRDAASERDIERVRASWAKVKNEFLRGTPRAPQR
jgi:hypothetical protein